MNLPQIAEILQEFGWDVIYPGTVLIDAYKDEVSCVVLHRESLDTYSFQFMTDDTDIQVSLNKDADYSRVRNLIEAQS